jgi:hypothetical protein
MLKQVLPNLFRDLLRTTTTNHDLNSFQKMLNQVQHDVFPNRHPELVSGSAEDNNKL